MRRNLAKQRSVSPFYGHTEDTLEVYSKSDRWLCVGSGTVPLWRELGSETIAPYRRQEGSSPGGNVFVGAPSIESGYASVATPRRWPKMCIERSRTGGDSQRPGVRLKRAAVSVHMAGYPSTYRLFVDISSNLPLEADVDLSPSPPLYLRPCTERHAHDVTPVRFPPDPPPPLVDSGPGRVPYALLIPVSPPPSTFPPPPAPTGLA